MYNSTNVNNHQCKLRLMYNSTNVHKHQCKFLKIIIYFICILVSMFFCKNVDVQTYMHKCVCTNVNIQMLTHSFVH